MMTPIERSPSVCWGTIGDDLLLFDPDDRRLHVLNSTAANVWMLADLPATVDDIVEELSSMYGLHRKLIAPDVDTLVANFLDAGLCLPSPVVGSGRPQPDMVLPRSTPRGPTIIGPFDCLGVSLTIETRDALLRSQLERILDPLRSPLLTGSGELTSLIQLEIRALDGVWEIFSSGALVTRTSTRAHALRIVLSECNAAPLRVIDSSVVFHAAGADLGTGAVLLPGVSNAGKSTLITQLLERGHRYLSDEAVAVDVESLHAIPYPKAICLDEGSQALFAHLEPADGLTSTWDVDPRSVGNGRLADGGVIAAIVFPSYDADAKTAIRPIEPFDTLQRLLTNAFDFDRVGQPAFAALIRMANALPAYTLEHGGGDQHLTMLENLFASPTVVSL